MRAMFDELSRKEVVNMTDGRRLGGIVDMELELDTGSIVNLIVPGEMRVFGLVRGERDYAVPWSSVIKIGDDVILVDIGVCEPQM